MTTLTYEQSKLEHEAELNRQDEEERARAAALVPRVEAFVEELMNEGASLYEVITALRQISQVPSLVAYDLMETAGLAHHTHPYFGK